MQVDQIVALAAKRFVARLLRRTAAALALLIFLVIAIYHFTVAGMIALDGTVGALDARLIVGGIYGLLALTALIALWAMRVKPASTAPPALKTPRELQLVMIVEAVMLGYSLARKREGAP